MLAVVTGGSGSGKSAFAEETVLSFGPAKRIYIATMHPFDEESHKRMARHRKMRAGKGFETVECYTGLMIWISRKMLWSFWNVCPIWSQMRCLGKKGLVKKRGKVTEGVKICFARYIMW